jgi:hypothetical protein
MSLQCSSASTATLIESSFSWASLRKTPPDRSAVPPLIGRMVALDAFSHALTNPLLSPHVFNEETFTPAGFASIAATSSLHDLAVRNLPSGRNRLSPRWGDLGALRKPSGPEQIFRLRKALFKANAGHCPAQHPAPVHCSGFPERSFVIRRHNRTHLNWEHQTASGGLV